MTLRGKKLKTDFSNFVRMAVGLECGRVNPNDFLCTRAILDIALQIGHIFDNSLTKQCTLQCLHFIIFDLCFFEIIVGKHTWLCLQRTDRAWPESEIPSMVQKMKCWSRYVSLLRGNQARTQHVAQFHCIYETLDLVLMCLMPLLEVGFNGPPESDKYWSLIIDSQLSSALNVIQCVHSACGPTFLQM